MQRAGHTWGRWTLLVALAVALVGGLGAARGERTLGARPTLAAPAAQTSEDEAWALEAAQRICEGDECIEDNLSAVVVHLLDCQKSATAFDWPRDSVRGVCERFVVVAKSQVSRAVVEVRNKEIQRLLNIKLVEPAKRLEGARYVSDCLLYALLAAPSAARDADNDLRAMCPEEWARVLVEWVEGETQSFVETLTPLLDQGLSAGGLLLVEDEFRTCLRAQPERSGPPDSDPLELCRATARAALPELPAAGGRPVFASMSCSPLSVSTGETVSCMANIVSPYTGLQWSAPGGSPNTGTDLTFSMRYDTGGVKTVELTACNTVQPGDRQLCTVGSATVAVNASPPVISALSCTPMQVAVRGVVNCTATLDGATSATTRRWSAPGGDPADGRGPSFSTTFAQPGTKSITFRTCNGPDPADGAGGDPNACAEASRAVTVTGAATATPTPTRMPTPAPTPAPAVTACSQWDVTGTWQTTQGVNRPSFTFQQSGTRITGTVTLSAADAARLRLPTSGSLEGTLVGRTLSIEVTWTGVVGLGTVTGRYRATVVQPVFASGPSGQGALQDGSARIGSLGADRWEGSGPIRCSS